MQAKRQDFKRRVLLRYSSGYEIREKNDALVEVNEAFVVVIQSIRSSDVGHYFIVEYLVSNKTRQLMFHIFPSYLARSSFVDNLWDRKTYILFTIQPFSTFDF